MGASQKSGGDQRGSSEHLLELRVRVVRLNFTLFKRSTIEATRERKTTPPAIPLASSRALQGFKQLRMVHGIPRSGTQWHRRIFYNWILYGDANSPFTGTHRILSDTPRDKDVHSPEEGPHARFIKALQAILSHSCPVNIDPRDP